MSTDLDRQPARATTTGPVAISWGRVGARLRGAYNYWVSTAGADGQPHAAPVWGVWFDDTFYFGTGRRSRKGRNLAANPRIVVHLESGDDVVILEGEATEVRDPAVLARLDDAYAAKYVDGDTGEPYRPLAVEAELDAVFYAVRPRLAHAWLEAAFVVSRNRWRFDAA